MASAPAARGLLAWGETLPKAFYTLWLMQRACEVQLAGATLGPAIAIPDEIQRRCAIDAHAHYGREAKGQDVFDALVRLVDRHDRLWRL